MMLKRGNKKAQFYLVAAIIIVMTISGIASVKTYSIMKSEPRKIQDIGQELRTEGTKIIDFGVYNPDDLRTLLYDFTDTEYAPYFLKKTEETSIVFIYGNKTDLWGTRYKEESTGTISASIGGGSTNWQMASTFAERTPITDDDGDGIVWVSILDRDFNFTLKNNEMFYFIITQEKDCLLYTSPSPRDRS